MKALQNIIPFDRAFAAIPKNKPQLKPLTEIEIIMPKLIVRHYPDAKLDFLRHQVGIPTIRAMHRPIYDGEKVVAEEEIDAVCQVFHLLGWGEDPKKARAMAVAQLAKMNLEVME